jgi:2-oxoglutarate ferredoxin oxidoreductase subunit alpha
MPKPVLEGPGTRELGILSVGSCDGAVREALGELEKHGLAFDYLRVRAFPFGAEVEDFLARHSTVFVVEQNRDAQLKSLLILETKVEKAKLRSVLHYDGMPLAAGFVVNAIEAALGSTRRKSAAAR